MGDSDADLVRAARDGRRAAYEELVRRYSGRIAAVCWAKLGRREAAEDMAQEAFLRGWRSLETLTEPERFGGWLYGIAVRACLDRLKDREWSQVPLAALAPDANADEFLVGQPPPSASPMEGEERHAKVLAEVQSLPEIYREVVTMFYFEQQTYEQMSALLGIGGAAINARLMKARLLLRSKLKGVMA